MGKKEEDEGDKGREEIKEGGEERTKTKDLQESNGSLPASSCMFNDGQRN